MTEAHNEVLKYKQNKKSTKIFIIYVDIESLDVDLRIHTYDNNLKNTVHVKNEQTHSM